MAKPVQEKRTGDMTIFEAKKHASELSRSQQDKKVYVIVHVETGWCGVSYQAEVPDNETHHCFKNGSEIAMDWKPTTKEPKSVRKPVKSGKVKEEKNVKLKAKAKEVMKKSSKKSAKKAAKKSGKKSAPKGNKKTMTIKEVIKSLKAGNVLFNAANGKRINLKKVMKRANTSAEWEVVIAPEQE